MRWLRREQDARRPRPAVPQVPQHRPASPAEAKAVPTPGLPRSPLAATTRFVVPGDVLAQTLAVLQGAGRYGNEAFVNWGGLVRDDGATLQIVSAVVPDQRAHQTPDGLLVTVDGQSLFEVNRALYKRGEVLAAQVHSHPDGAYHSSTDDCFSLVTLTGALSVVVPRFGTDGLNGCRGWAWYRLTGLGQWALLGPEDKVEIVHEDVT